MAITGKFEADFSDFHKGVQEAEKDLAKLATSGDRAGASLAKMTGATKGAVAPVNDLRTAYQQFDGALAAVGVNIGPQVRGIEDMATAAKAGGAGLGLLAKAGLAFGAGMGAYGITRAALELTGLSAAVDTAAERWFQWNLGLGDKKAAGAAAAVEVLAKASRIAGVEVTSLAQAVKINEEAQKQWASKFEAPAKLALFEASLKKASAETAALTKHERELIVEAIKVGTSHADIAAGLTVATAAVTKYVAALKWFADAQKLGRSEAERFAKLDAKNVEETAQLWREFGVQKIAMSGTETEAKIADLARWRDDEIGKLDTSLKGYEKHKDAILALSKQQADAQMVDWDFLRTHSIEGLQETADKAKATYDEMLFGSRTFTREALDEQLQKTRDTAFAATAMGQAYTEGLDSAAVKARVLLEQFAALAAASQKAWDALKGRNAEGITQDVTSENVFAVAQGQGAGFNQLRHLQALLAEGYSPADALKIIQGASKDDFTTRKKATSAPGPRGNAGGPQGDTARGRGDEAVTRGGGGGGGGVSSNDTPVLGYQIMRRGDKWWYTGKMPPGAENRRDQYESDAAWDEYHPGGGGFDPGGGTTITVHQHISGVWDPASKRALKEATDEALMTALRQTRRLGAA